MREETLTIEKLVYGGDALGRLSSGEVVFVPGGLPGEQVTVTVESKKKGVGKATLKAVNTPSPHRITPQCSVFDTCGGCHWQHLAIEEQRHWKTEIVRESLKRLGKFPESNVLPIISDVSWQYRNRVQWVVIPGDPPRLGYRAEESHTGVPFETCHIMPASFQALKQWFETEPERLHGLSGLHLQTNANGEWLLALMPDETAESDPETIVQAVTEAFPQLAGDDRLRHTVGGQIFETSAQSFFQVNLAVTEKMLAYLDEILPTAMDTFLDVYSGVGLFSLHVAPRASTVLGIEYDEGAVSLAVENARLNDIHNARFLAGDAAKILSDLSETFEVALVDPPRKGCDPAVLSALTQNVTRQLVYVSCNPTTLARDLRLLADQGWRLGSVQPFDMFPHTYHVEAIATLSRS